MLDDPKDVDGKCNAHLYIGDDDGDNSATMRCRREPNHEGKHRETYKAAIAGEVVVEWEYDERPPKPTERTRQTFATLVAWLKESGFNPDEPSEAHDGGMNVDVNANAGWATGWVWFSIMNSGDDSVSAFNNDGLMWEAPLDDESKARAVAFLKGAPQ